MAGGMKSYNFEMHREHNADFTTESFVELLQLAKRNYKFISYADICTSSEKYILWRHDVDLSLNRALKLAKIEHNEGIQATYFVNPHCNFYNLLERSQSQHIKQILSLGHSIGLHFDVDYYQIENEGQLDKLVAEEAALLQSLFATEIKAFSFHNPNAFMLSCEKEQYGGLINCYSTLFKKEIAYCSDSNGYWRFKRLRDVLEEASDPRLQILTHPGLWQDQIMSPRERVFRCVDMRANRVMQNYDELLRIAGRNNLGTLSDEFRFLKSRFAGKAEQLDYRWMRGELEGVFLDLWRMLDSYLFRSCRILFIRSRLASRAEFNALIESTAFQIPIHRLFALISRKNWEEIFSESEQSFLYWQGVRNHILHGLRRFEKHTIMEGVVFVIGIMERLSRFIEEDFHIAIRHMPRMHRTSEKFKLEKDSYVAWLYENSAQLENFQGTLITFLNETKEEKKC